MTKLLVGVHTTASVYVSSRFFFDCNCCLCLLCGCLSVGHLSVCITISIPSSCVTEQGRAVWGRQVKQNRPIVVGGKAPQLPYLLTPEQTLLTPKEALLPSKEDLLTPDFAGVRKASPSISRQGACGVHRQRRE